ncbi:UNVERIFIED_CONTAM: hypothetical protein LK11_36530 [Mumia flava]
MDPGDAVTGPALLALQRASYAVEAELIAFPDLPLLTESLEQLRASTATFLGALDGDRLVGAVSWFRLDDGTVDIDRLVVDPAHHRRGIASALLDALAGWAPTHRTVVATGSANGPALALYVRHGFVSCGEREVADGVRVTDLERGAAPGG